MKKSRTFKGQELVEFALILPVMVVVLVALAEMGFMWTLRGNVSDAVKISVQHLQALAGTDTNTVKAQLATDIRDYLTSHGIPNSNSVTINFVNDASGNYTTVNVSYTYNPAFTLPNFFGIQLLPDSITMTSSQILNNALLSNNNFVNTAGLPLNNTSDSILKADPNGIRRQMAFLIDLPGDVDPIVNWWGHSIFPAGAGVSSANGTIVVKTPYNQNEFGASLSNTPGTGGWTDSDETYAGVLLANGYTNVVYVDGSSGISQASNELPGYGNIYSGDFGPALKNKWCTPGSSSVAGEGTGVNCDGDISADNSNLVKLSMTQIGSGFEILPPAPGTKSGIEPVSSGSVPVNYSIPDNTYREIVIQDAGSTKLKFYVPKAAISTNKFKKPADANNAVSLATYLRQCIDADGDGVPTYWDLDPAMGDADRDGRVDGYQVRSAASDTIANAPEYRQNYRIKEVASKQEKIGANIGVPLKGVIPNGKISVPHYQLPFGAPLPFPAPDTLQYLDMRADAPALDFDRYAPSTCAVGGCSTKQPYFLRATEEYKTTTGKRVTPSKSSGLSTYYNAEKYREPDPKKRIYQIEVVTRDHNNDNIIMVVDPQNPAPNNCPLWGNDNGNPLVDCINNANSTDIRNYGPTKGLMFVDETSVGSGAYVGGESYSTVVTSASMTNLLDYAATSLNAADPTVSAMSSKASFTVP